MIHDSSKPINVKVSNGGSDAGVTSSKLIMGAQQMCVSPGKPYNPTTARSLLVTLDDYRNLAGLDLQLPNVIV
ncbi:cellulase [Anopheles sinensis]|uniref:Cellulase n=1 Tax=Anopheles sinensis TaxID=74873 RepID=A0A084VHN6_ANOSI|nr:cellulase [Anopheles sinensis]